MPRLLASRWPDRPAVVDERRTLSFRELDEEASSLAAGMNREGIGNGHRILLLAGNSVEWLTHAFGVWRSGATLVPVSTFVTGAELRRQLEHAGADAVLVQPRLHRRDFLALLDEARDLVPASRTFVLGDDGPTPWRSARGLRAAPGPARPVDPEAIAAILYTSGTTGQPKGVMLSHRAILATVGPTVERSGLGSSDELLSTLPLFWVAGLVIRALPTLTAGCTLHLPGTVTPDALVAALHRRPPTALHLRPPQVADLLAHPRFDRRILARVRKGNGRTEWFAGSLPADARFITGYGMTEMSGYVTALDWQDADPVRASVGRPLPGVGLEILDESSRPLPAGKTGEIRVRGPGLFSGYHGEPAGTGLDADGWFRTGDLGRLDANGALHFVGRTKDLLRVKGINVSPVEVENEIASHPHVRAAFVVGLPADALEQRVVALVVGDGGDEHALENELRALCAGRLSHYKRPEAYLFLRNDEVPLGGTSKPLRGELASLAAQRGATQMRSRATSGEAPGGRGSGGRPRTVRARFSAS